MENNLDDVQDDKIIAALKHTLEHISLHQKKFKDINLELQRAKHELEQEKDKWVDECSQLKKKNEHLHDELNQFKSVSKEQSTKISELQIKCAQTTQENAALIHQLQDQINLGNDSNAHDIQHQLQNDNKILQKQISTLGHELDCTNNQIQSVLNENEELKQKIESVHRIKEERGTESESLELQLKELEAKHNILTQQYTELKQSAKDKTIIYQNHSERLSNVSTCSFSMIRNCKRLRESIIYTTIYISEQQQVMKTEFQETLKKISTLRLQNMQKKQLRSHTDQLKMQEAIKINLEAVKNTKISLNEFRKDVINELKCFDTNIKSVQRAIFKQKAMVHQQMNKAKDKTAKLTECLMENEQNMEHKLKEYLKQKAELQGKIGKLETFLKDKHQRDIVTEMKRFRSAAIVTSITSLSENGNNSISYHRLSEHERKAISLKSKFEKQINGHGNVDINEKVDEFVRSGGLKRYPILEHQFQYEPNDIDKNRFRFGSKYISILYNMKRNELYIKNDNNGTTQLLQDWIAKNGSNEMRKLLAKISQKRKANKQLLQPKTTLT